MFASGYFPNSYFPKSYFPECIVGGELVVVNQPGAYGNRKNLPKKRRYISVRELLDRDRLEASKKSESESLSTGFIAKPMFVGLSAESEELLREINALRPQIDAEILVKRIKSARAMFLLGLFNG